MIVGIFVVFFVSFVLLVHPSKIKSINRITSSVLVLILIAFAGFRDGKKFNDYGMYVQAWNRLDYSANQIEISYIFIRNLLRDNFEFSYISIFVLYAILGVTSKVIAIRNMTNLFYLSILMYVSHFYILHELTQIRAGVAAGFILLAIKPLYDRNFKYFVLFVAIATFFHYSAILILTLWLLKNNSKIKILYFIVPAGYILYFVGFNFIQNIPIPYFQTKLEAYQELSRKGVGGYDTINVFNAFYLVKVAIFYLILINHNKIAPYNKYFYLLVKIEGIALCALPSLSLIPAIAYRVHELFGIVELILFPLVIYIFKVRIVGYCFAIALALIFLCVNVFYNQLILS